MQKSDAVSAVNVRVGEESGTAALGEADGVSGRSFGRRGKGRSAFLIDLRQSALQLS
jgi:hypothetical protein